MADLQLMPYNVLKVEDLTPEQEKMRLEIARTVEALHASGDLPSIIFMGERIFSFQ